MKQRHLAALFLFSILVLAGCASSGPIMVRNPNTGHTFSCGDYSPEFAKTATTIFSLGLNKLFIDSGIEEACASSAAQYGYVKVK